MCFLFLGFSLFFLLVKVSSPQSCVKTWREKEKELVIQSCSLPKFPSSKEIELNLTFINSQGNKVSPQEGNFSYEKVTSLDYSHNKISSPDDTSQGFVSVSQLMLQDNELTVIADGLFEKDGLFEGGKLLYLNLSRNKISSIEDSAFSGLSNLVSLSLDSNKLTKIELVSPSIPNEELYGGKLAKLTYLNLAHNSIRSVDNEVFAGLTSLLTLELQGNQLTTVDRQYFVGLEMLSYLNLNGNDIRSIRGAFDIMAELKKLDLSKNLLSVLDLSRLGPHNKLEFLRLDRNRLSDIPPNLFSELKALTFLDLSENFLVSLEKDLFKDLKNLKHLCLNGNHIHDIPPNLFSGLKALTFLDLSKNLLVSLEKDLFKDLKNLKHLCLNGNHIHDIPPNLFSGLKALTFLKINNGVGDNAITDIGPKAFPAISPNFIKLQLGKSFSCKARSDYRNLLKFTDDFCTLETGTVQSFKTFLKDNSRENEGLTPGLRGQSGEGEISNAGVAVPICVQVGVLALCLLISFLGLY
ncbi:leucine-rich repeat-containing protein 15-like isoform X3 [Zophobas morio]|uniref:leucine-rich repeat-containing protein 15-like isoform X3 n=1 Tax=Zophobas morio TaxID=2755281 RepID=UPI003083A9B5